MSYLLNTSPLISVVMSLYNDSLFVTAAIDSILNQTISDFEFIIINDGSVDDTLDKVRKFHDPRIRVIHQLHQGLAASLNIGIRAAKGLYIARQDGDDISFPTRFEQQLTFFQTDVGLGLVGANAILIDEEGFCLGESELPLSDKEIRQNLISDEAANPLIHGACMFYRKNVLRIGGYRTEFRHAQDLDLWLRLSEYVHVANLPMASYYLRLRHQGVGNKNRQSQRDYARLARLCARRRLAGEAEPTLSIENVKKRRFVFHFFSLIRRGRPIIEYKMNMAILLFNSHRMKDARKDLFSVVIHNPFHFYAWLLLSLSFLPYGLAANLHLQLQKIYRNFIWKN